jgi:mannobiose 2-epimerase
MINIFREELITCLRTNILNYWIEKMVDPNGGFYGRRNGHDVLDVDAPKGAVLNARILWSFSAAYRVLRDKKYLDMATRAKREIIDRFYDKEYGGIYWSLDAQGNPLDTKKQFYALGFAIYGLSEYSRATNDSEALEYAIRLYHDIENHSRDKARGGYIEALTRDWQPIDDMRLSDKDDNSSKTMNTHLHIIEPYTNLLRVWRDETLRQTTESLLSVFFDKIMDKNTGHLGLFFDNDWHRQDNIISYGHDIEASWLLLETAQVLGNSKYMPTVLNNTQRIANAALEGRCDDGSMIYERHSDGTLDKDKHWWVQAETVIGQVYLGAFHNQPEMIDKAYQSWQYIKGNIIDYEGGEWHWSRRKGRVNREDDKAGFWKCPYHNTRMCLEVYECLTAL